MSDSFESHNQEHDQEHHPSTPLLDELYALAAGHADEQLSHEEIQRLESLLVDHGELCDRFLDYMQMMSALESEPTRLREYLAQGTDISNGNLGSQATSPSVIPSFDINDQDVFAAGTSSEANASTSGVPILGFLGHCMKSGFSFLSRPNVLSLLLAVGLPGLILVVLAVQLADKPAPRHVIATITQTHECVWSKGDESPRVGSSLFAGEQLRLAKGLLEITYDQGSTVLLKGPATFNVTNNAQGYLRDGSLVARVQKGSEGFTIQTPAIDVVDLGTEFGVCVDKQRTTKVEVFQGKVKLQAVNKKQINEKLHKSLTAGHAVRVEMASRQGSLPIISKIAPTVNTFVRHMPTPVKPKELDTAKVIVADFSDGMGTSRVDQYPGVAGKGWATGWRGAGSKGIKLSTSIKQTNQVLGGGQYLRALTEWESGTPTNLAEADLERRLALTDKVDLSRPYVVSLNLRVDALDRFTEPGDRLTICSRRPPRVEGKREGINSSGWHISATGQDPRFGNTKNWVFFGRDKANKSRAIDSGILVQEGDIYSFRILVDPTTAQWTPSIAVNGGEWNEFETMKMRTGGTAEQSDYWPILYFYCRMRDGNKEEGMKRIGFSVDSISIIPK